MKKAIMKAIVVSVSVSLAHAALDETQQQIEQRYGPPSKVEKPSFPATHAATYEKGELKIYVAYIGGRAAYKKYTGFDDADVESILKANQIGMQRWVEVASSSSGSKHYNKKATHHNLRMKGTGGHWIIPGGAAEASKGGDKKKGYYLEIASDQWLRIKASGF